MPLLGEQLMRTESYRPRYDERSAPERVRHAKVEIRHPEHDSSAYRDPAPDHRAVCDYGHSRNRGLGPRFHEYNRNAVNTQVNCSTVNCPTTAVSPGTRTRPVNSSRDAGVLRSRRPGERRLAELEVEMKRNSGV